MNRWSLSKIFSSVTALEFRDAISSIQQSMEETCQSEIDVTVKFYNGMKHSISTIQPGIQEYLDRENESKVFAEITTAKYFTDELWDQATYVEAILNTSDEDNAPDYAFGHIEAKGLLKKTMNLYAQPEQVGEKAEELSKKHFKTWRKGDGYESNHVVTLG